MKKIIFDAKWLYKSPPSGRVVIKNLVKELKNHTKQYEITLLIDKNDPHANKYIDDGFKIKEIPNYSLISNLFIYPFLFSFHKYDAGIFQNTTPFFFRGKSYQFIHDVIFDSNPNFFTKKELMLFKLIKISSLFSNKIITISNNEKNRLIKYGYKREKDIYVVYHGANHITPKELPYHKKLLEKLEIPEKFVLYVGRINIRKNIGKLIEAVNLLNNRVALVIVGEKSWKTESSNLHSENIYFTGYVDDETLSFLYSQSIAFVFPSLEEGFGLPPIEAMMHQTPVIISRTSCFPEICKDAAIYINPLDSKEIALAIELLMNNEELRKQKIRNGLLVSSTYTWKKSIEQIIKIIETN